MEEERPEPKISIPEAIVAGGMILLADGIELLILFLGLDDFWISDAIAFPITQLYLRLKGVKGTMSLAANIIELIPYVGWLPLRTLGFIGVVYMDHHPKMGGVLAAAVPGAAVIRAKGMAQGRSAGLPGKNREASPRRTAEGTEAEYGPVPPDKSAEAGVVGAGAAAKFEPLQELENKMSQIEVQKYPQEETAPPVRLEDIKHVDKEEPRELL